MKTKPATIPAVSQQPRTSDDPAAGPPLAAPVPITTGFQSSGTAAVPHPLLNRGTRESSRPDAAAFTAGSDGAVTVAGGRSPRRCASPEALPGTVPPKRQRRSPPAATARAAEPAMVEASSAHLPGGSPCVGDGAPVPSSADGSRTQPAADARSLTRERLEVDLATYDQQLQGNANDGMTLVFKSHVLQQLGRWQEALDTCDRAAAFQCDAPALHISRTISLHALGNYRDAILAAEAVPPTNPVYPVVARAKALSLCSLGEVQAGLDLMNNLVRSNPDSPLPYLLRADILQHQSIRRPDFALEDLAKAVDRAPENSTDYPIGLGKLGNLQLATGNPREAIATFKKVLRLQPGQYAAHLGIGKAMAILRRPDLAVKAFDNALLLRPVTADVHHERAHALIALDRFPEAIEDFRKITVANPQASVPRFMLGALLVKEARFDEALAEIDTGLRINPNHVEAHNIRALALDGMADGAREKAAELRARREQGQL